MKKRLWAMLSRLKAKVTRKLIVVGISIVTFISVNVPMGFCADDDTSAIIVTWMPTIVSFAMLGMVLGLVKKYAK